MPSDRAVALATQWNTEAAGIVGGETVPTGHRHTETDIDDLTTALAARIANSRIGAANGVAPLDATAKVPVANLPDISTTRGVFPVASQSAMLALNAQVGAVAVRSDLAGQSYILAALPASNLANWLTQSPPGTVTSVNGQTGAVTIPLPALATTTTDGLMPAGDRLILSATGATANQTLRYNGTAIVWATPTIWTVRTSNTTLAANENCMASTGVTQLTLPATVSGGHEIANDTTSAILVGRGGAATISGIARSTGLAISSATLVRVMPGQRAVFIASGGNWIAQGCESTALSFTYNGTPLSNNTSNPSSAGGLFHYLGIIQGGGTWTNPANTPILVSATTGAMVGTVANLTDRVSSGQSVHSDNVAGSWFGWQFVKPFRCTGFILQTRGGDTNHLPRQFEIRVNTGTGLTTGTNVTTWTSVQSWTGQTQITDMNTYYGPFTVSSPIWGNQLAIRQTGLSASNNNIFAAQEFELFGDYEV